MPVSWCDISFDEVKMRKLTMNSTIQRYGKRDKKRQKKTHTQSLRSHHAEFICDEKWWIVVTKSHDFPTQNSSNHVLVSDCLLRFCWILLSFLMLSEIIYSHMPSTINATLNLRNGKLWNIFYAKMNLLLFFSRRHFLEEKKISNSFLHSNK